MQEPGIYRGMTVDLSDCHAAAQGIAHIPEPVTVGHTQFFQQQLLLLAGQGAPCLAA